MELHQLRYFVAVAEEKSFSRAAERMRIAQPSLSQQIQKLEASLGRPLFDRLPRSVALTAAGLGLMPFARRILSEVTHAQNSVTSNDLEPSGEVTVGLIPTIAPYLLDRLWKELHVVHPGLNVRILEDVTENLVREVENGTVDGAIISTCRKRPGLHLEECLSEPLLLAVASGSAQANLKTLRPKDLHNISILQLHESHCLSERVRRWCRENRVRLGDEVPVLQLGTLLAAVGAGRGACFVPRMAVGIEHAHGCVFLPISKRGPERELNLLRHASRSQSRSAVAFTDVARVVLERMDLEFRAAEETSARVSA